MVARLFTPALLLVGLAVSACGSGSSVERSNASTTAQLNAISSNTADTAGASPSVAPLTPDDLGQSMRAGAAAKPRDH